MADGLILLGFIAIVTAVVTARVRRRMGFPVRQGFYATAITAIARPWTTPSKTIWLLIQETATWFM